MAILQEQLRQSQKMEAIGRLAGGIAHDFNNLLTIIKGYSQVSLLELKEGDPVKTNIEEIQTASNRAADLTKQLLAFSRRQIMEFNVIDLNTVLQDLRKMLQRIIGEDVELLTSFQEDLWRVRVDSGQINQVVMNLAVNAKDAMPQGGKLTLETANAELDEEYARKHVAVKPGSYVMLSASDTGIGMSPEVKERIFEPFFTTKERGKGTGLGLSTVYGIVKQSGGNIWVYSEEGKGTTFKIYLPREEEPLSEMRVKPFLKEELTGGNETILVVEDDEEVRKLAVHILKKRGYKVLEATEGVEAISIGKKYKDPIHLLVTDVVMPKMNGQAVAEELSGVHPETKVLYMSGYTDNTIAHFGVLEEGVEYIQKPFAVDNLVRQVRVILDN
jgi:CheY-like chemotaxis protein